MKNKNIKSIDIKKIMEIVEERNKQEKEQEENRKRLMMKQLQNVIGANKIVINGNFKAKQTAQ